MLDFGNPKFDMFRNPRGSNRPVEVLFWALLIVSAGYLSAAPSAPPRGTVVPGGPGGSLMFTNFL